MPIEASAGRDTGGEHALITLAEQTGGKHFYVDEGGLDKAFAQVSEDLRTQYMIGYYPSHQEPGTDFHRIVVTIPRAAPDEFNIRNKTGYYSDDSCPRQLMVGPAGREHAGRFSARGPRGAVNTKPSAA